MDSQPTGLSIREQQVLQLVREGRVDSEIAVRLGLGTGEVKQTVAVLVSKCGVSDRAGLVTGSERPRSSPGRWRFDAFADRLSVNAGSLALIAIVLGAAVILVWRAVSGDDEPVDLSGLQTQTATNSTTPSPAGGAGD